MRADAPNRIDMDKYNEYIKHNETSTLHHGEGDIYEQFPNSNGELVGPASIKENAMQWVEFSNKYNIPVYFDYTFCGNSNEELMKGVSELYDLGIEKLTVFNTVLAYRPTPIWNLVRNLGHKEDSAEFTKYSEGCKKAYQELVSGGKYDLDTDRQAQLVRPLALDLLTE